MVILAVKGIAQVGSSAKMNHVQTTKKANKSTGKSSTVKSKGSSSSLKQTKGSSSKQTKSSNTKKATAKSTQATTKEKKGSSLTNGLGKSVADLAKSIVSKEPKKQSDESQKVASSNGRNTTKSSSISSSIKTTGQSGNSSSGVANNSTKKVITGKETTYATGAAGIYNAKGKIVSGAVKAANDVLASTQIIGYNSLVGNGHTSAYSYNRPPESGSYETMKAKLKAGNKKGTVKEKDGKVTISYITKPNGTEKAVVKKKLSWFEQTIRKYGTKIKYVVTDDGIKEFTSFLAGFVPYAGDTIDIVDAATGKDIITGEKLKVDERAITTLAVLPVISGPMIRGGLDALKKIDLKKIKGLKKVKIVARQSDKVDDVADVGKKVAKEEKEKLIKKGVENSEDDIIKDGSHLRDGKLKANITYKAGEFDYIYKTDSKGRISNWSTDNLQLTKRKERLKYNSKTPGKTQGDHAGHIAGDRFGGSPEIDNIVSQASSVNLSEYKKIENQWAKAIREGKKVTTDVTILYEGDSLRPKGFEVKYTINNKLYNKKILN